MDDNCQAIKGPKFKMVNIAITGNLKGPKYNQIVNGHVTVIYPCSVY